MRFRKILLEGQFFLHDTEHDRKSWFFKVSQTCLGDTKESVGKSGSISGVPGSVLGDFWVVYCLKENMCLDAFSTFSVIRVRYIHVMYKGSDHRKHWITCVGAILKLTCRGRGVCYEIERTARARVPGKWVRHKNRRDRTPTMYETVKSGYRARCVSAGRRKALRVTRAVNNGWRFTARNKLKMKFFENE